MTFPYDICRVLFGDFAMRWEPSAGHTDDAMPGLYAQGGDHALPMFTRTFRFEVSEADVHAFRSWLESNGNTWFDFADPDGVQRRVRVRGGAQHSLSGLAHARGADGKAVLTGTMTVEGLYDAGAAALPLRAWPRTITDIQFSGYTLRNRHSTRRVPFEDGYAREKQVNSEPLLERDITFTMAGADVPGFLAWAQAVGSDVFRFADVDGNVRGARIRQGQGGVELRGIDSVRQGTDVVWQGSCTLVGKPRLFSDAVVTIGGDTVTIGGEAVTIGFT